jgi:hypothetical protein
VGAAASWRLGERRPNPSRDERAKEGEEQWTRRRRGDGVGGTKKRRIQG